MSKERYYYRGDEDDDGLYYRIEKVCESRRNNEPSFDYFDTPEECKAYCEACNHLMFTGREADYSNNLKKSYQRIQLGGFS